MIARVMLDTGALIALERRHLRICKIHWASLARASRTTSPLLEPSWGR